MTRFINEINKTINHNIQRGSHISLGIPRIGIQSVGFCGGRKTIEPERKKKKTLVASRELTTNSTRLWHRVGVEPRPDWWGASALSTVPSLLPLSKRKTPCWLFRFPRIFQRPYTRLLHVNIALLASLIYSTPGAIFLAHFHLTDVSKFLHKISIVVSFSRKFLFLKFRQCDQYTKY